MKKIFDIVPQSEIDQNAGVMPRQTVRPRPVTPEPVLRHVHPQEVETEIVEIHKPVPDYPMSPRDDVGNAESDAFAVLRHKESRPPLWKEVGHRFRLRLRVPLWVAIAGVGLLVVLGTLTFLYPRVNIAIAAKKAELTGTMFLTIDGSRENIAPESTAEVSATAKMGGKYISLTEETTRTFPATGKHSAKTKARGSITIFNAYSTAPQSLVATTRLETSDGKIFRLLASATIPTATMESGKIKASSVVVEVEADQAGAAYNIGPSDFTIPGFKGSTKFTGFYGKSYAAMKGGAEGQTAVVSEEDIAQARQKLRDELASILTKRMEEQTGEPWELFTDATDIAIVTATPSVTPGAAGDNFQMHFKLRLETVAFKKADLETLVVTQNRQRIANPEQQRLQLKTFSIADARIDSAKKTLTGQVNAAVEVDAIVNADSLKESILGKSEVELRTFLAAQEGIETARVTFWPFWVSRVPERSDLVTVAID